MVEQNEEEIQGHVMGKAGVVRLDKSCFKIRDKMLQTRYSIQVAADINANELSAEKLIQSHLHILHLS